MQGLESKPREKAAGGCKDPWTEEPGGGSERSGRIPHADPIVPSGCEGKLGVALERVFADDARGWQCHFVLCLQWGPKPSASWPGS